MCDAWLVAVLKKIDVPTLILTPSHDRLIGPEAARILREGILQATEAVLPDTGHMFRFTHPHTYARAIEKFLAARYVFHDYLRAKAGPALRRMEAGFNENALSYLLFLRLVPLFPFWLVNLVPAFLGVGLGAAVGEGEGESVGSVEAAGPFGTDPLFEAGI